MTRHYYAEYCPYGVNTLSGSDELHRYDTKRQRDEAVASGNDGAGYAHEMKWEAVTLRDVAHRYRLADFGDTWRCERDEDGSLFICRR